VEENYTQAEKLCEQLGETTQLFPVLWTLSRIRNWRGELPAARQLALRVPQKFVNDNGIDGFLFAQHETKSYVVKSPESVQYSLWSRWFM
jgi:hypothetical protein